MDTKTAKEIIAYNREFIYHPPAAYPFIDYYLDDKLKETLLAVYRFINKLNSLIIYRNKYCFFLDSKHLTYGARRKAGGEGTSSRHINLLCAVGLLNKQYQNGEDAIEINRLFMAQTGATRPMNVFYIKLYDRQELARIESRAERLFHAGITRGNISFNNLCLHGLSDIATEVYPLNDRTAPERKIDELSSLIRCMDFLISEQGYTTRQQVHDYLPIDDKEIDKLFKLFKIDLGELYYYGRPTAQDKAEFNLTDNKYIYKKRG